MKVLSYPNPFLRHKVKPVNEITDELRQAVAHMFETMYQAKGIGLAATQVGIDQAVFVINLTGEPAGEMVFINPELLDAQGNRREPEACLSLPGLEAKINRSAAVHVRALDLKGEPFEMEESDFPARVLQHEMDHLSGVLLIDKVGPAARIGLRGRLKELEQHYRPDDED